MTEEEKRVQEIDLEGDTESLELDDSFNEQSISSAVAEPVVSTTDYSQSPFMYGEIQTTNSVQPEINSTPVVESNGESVTTSFEYQEVQPVTPVEPAVQNPYVYTEQASSEPLTSSFQYQEVQPVAPVEPAVQNPYVYTEQASSEPLTSSFEYQEVQPVAPVEPVAQNPYDYATPSEPVIEQPQNAFVYNEPAQVSDTVAQVPTDNFSYVEESNSKLVPQENSKTYNPNVNFPTEDTTRIAADTKSNLVFVAIFGIAMLIIIFVLPYISGYN